MYVGMYCEGFRVTIWNGDSYPYVGMAHYVLQHWEFSFKLFFLIHRNFYIQIFKIVKILCTVR